MKASTYLWNMDALAAVVEGPDEGGGRGVGDEVAGDVDLLPPRRAVVHGLLRGAHRRDCRGMV